MEEKYCTKCGAEFNTEPSISICPYCKDFTLKKKEDKNFKSNLNDIPNSSGDDLSNFSDSSFKKGVSKCITNLKKKQYDSESENQEIIELIRKFDENIKSVKNLYNKVKIQSKEINDYVLKNNININDTNAVENLKKTFAESSRNRKLNDIDKLIKRISPQECLDSIYISIDGYHLICKELSKLIEKSKKLYNQGKIKGVQSFLPLDYFAAISLQMAYVTTLIIINNNPKYAQFNLKIPIERISVYMNRPLS